jgi:hypothetical protein
MQRIVDLAPGDLLKAVRRENAHLKEVLFSQLMVSPEAQAF